MPPSLAPIPSWGDIRKELNSKTVERIAETIGSGTKTAGARRFFGWVTSSPDPEAKWMLLFLADDNRNPDDPLSIRLAHNAIRRWQSSLLDQKKWKSATVRGLRDHLLGALDKLRDDGDLSFPIIESRLIGFGVHHDSTGYTALGELEWPEYTNVEPAKRDAVGIALVRQTAISVFENYEALFQLGQRILQGNDTGEQVPESLKTLIADEFDSWHNARRSIFSIPWTNSIRSRIASLTDPTLWTSLGIAFNPLKKKTQFSAISDLVTSCIGPNFRVNQAVQTIFCCETAWNRQPIQRLPKNPFAFRTQGEIFLGSERVLANFKNRAQHTVFAHPDIAEIVKGVAEKNYQASWDAVAETLGIEKCDEAAKISADGALFSVLRRYEAMQKHSRNWVDGETVGLFFHALSQRGSGVRVADKGLGDNMPEGPLRRSGANFSAIRKAFLNTFSVAGFEPSFISEIAGHRSGGILQANYFIGAQANRVYEEPIRFWQGCIQELVLTDRTAIFLNIPEDNREWFKMLGLITGVTAACGMEPYELEGTVLDDFIFDPTPVNLRDLFLGHHSLIKQRFNFPHQRWMVQGIPLLSLIKAVGRKCFAKNLGNQYWAAARAAKIKLRTKEISLPMLLEL